MDFGRGPEFVDVLGVEIEEEEDTGADGGREVFDEGAGGSDLIEVEVMEVEIDGW